MKDFVLSASIKTADMDKIEPVLRALVPEASIKKEGNEFIVNVTLKGDNSRDLNRNILSGMRKVIKKTRMKSEWKSENIIEHFFDYGLRKTTDI